MEMQHLIEVVIGLWRGEVHVKMEGLSNKQNEKQQLNKYNLCGIIDLLDSAAGFLCEQIQSSQIYSLFQKSLANFFVQISPEICL